MSALPFGIYEEILTHLRKQQLDHLGAAADARLDDLDAGDSHAALADYLRAAIADALESVDGDNRSSRTYTPESRLGQDLVWQRA